jgi:uncharacterized repeat protein (TIGR03803 family)
MTDERLFALDRHRSAQESKLASRGAPESQEATLKRLRIIGCIYAVLVESGLVSLVKTLDDDRSLALTAVVCEEIAPPMIPIGEGKDNGALPGGGLVSLGDSLYGTTRGGGSGKCGFGVDGCGIAFKMSTTGKMQILYSFHATDGTSPDAPLAAVRGVLYGTTGSGGSDCKGECGTIFSLSTSGKERVLHSFGPRYDFPNGGLLYLNGALYGTTGEGGTHKQGAIYMFML